MSGIAFITTKLEAYKYNLSNVFCIIGLQIKYDEVMASTNP